MNNPDHLDNRPRVPAGAFEVGKRYYGTVVGEFQKDKDGRYWHKRWDGSIMEVKPHPDSLFLEVTKEEEDK